MARKKKISKAKEPIRLRERKLANGNISLYLDIYDNGDRCYEYLKLYLIPEKDSAAKIQNENVRKAAEAIKAQRMLQLINNEAGIKTNKELSKVLVVDWVEQFMEKSKLNHRGLGFYHMVGYMKNYLVSFMGDSVKSKKLKDVDETFCRDFLEHLKVARIGKRKRLSPTTVHHYFFAWNNCLERAVVENVIPINPINTLKALKETPMRPDVEKPYLTADEVKKLIETDCFDKDLKKAFLFACNTGLRESDIVGLKWENINFDGKRWRLAIVMKKTQKPIELLLTEGARKWLPEKPATAKGKDPIFHLHTIPCCNNHLKKWAKSAGISKNISMHTARHTFGTVAITNGVDISTIASLMGHKSMQTTMIYAKSVSKVRDSAIGKISDAFK